MISQHGILHFNVICHIGIPQNADKEPARKISADLTIVSKTCSNVYNS